jgi:tRNA pseudouridine55 synthase
MFGLLNLDKPAGATSRDVVNQVQRLVKPVKAGHAGTLDPLATGVHVVGLCPATRLVEYDQRMPKTYLATFELGRQSDTEDTQGQVVELENPPVPSGEQIQSSLSPFVGLIRQQPPAFSALKVDGRRAYDLARQGLSVDLAPREIEIHSLEIIAYKYPTLRLRIVCGSGTYVRSLGRDLARSLGTQAVMSSLRREAIGPFLAEQAMKPGVLTRETIHQHMLPPTLAVAGLPQVVILPEEARRFAQGQRVANRWSLIAEEVAACDEAGNLLALASAGAQRLQPLKCFG